MKIIIQIPDNAVKMFVDLADALRTIAKTVEVETKDEGTVDGAIQEVEEKRNLDAFQKLADENKPTVSLNEVRAVMAEMMREAGEAVGAGAGKDLAKNLLERFGAKKLTEVDPKHYAELKAAAEDTLKQLREARQ